MSLIHVLGLGLDLHVLGLGLCVLGLGLEKFLKSLALASTLRSLALLQHCVLCHLSFHSTLNTIFIQLVAVRNFSQFSTQVVDGKVFHKVQTQTILHLSSVVLNLRPSDVVLRHNLLLIRCRCHFAHRGCDSRTKNRIVFNAPLPHKCTFGYTMFHQIECINFCSYIFDYACLGREAYCF